MHVKHEAKIITYNRKLEYKEEDQRQGIVLEKVFVY